MANLLSRIRVELRSICRVCPASEITRTGQPKPSERDAPHYEHTHNTRHFDLERRFDFVAHTWRGGLAYCRCQLIKMAPGNLGDLRYSRFIGEDSGVFRNLGKKSADGVGGGHRLRVIANSMPPTKPRPGMRTLRISS